MKLIFYLLTWAIAVTARVVRPTVVSPDWTYLDVLNYALCHGGANDAVAHLIYSHMQRSPHIRWDDVYRGDITYQGATLTVAKTPHGRRLRAKAGRFSNYATHTGCSSHESAESPLRVQEKPSTEMIFPITGTVVEAYLFVDTCDGDVAFTWEDLNNLTCFGFFNSDGQEIRMFSIFVTVPDLNGSCLQITLWRDQGFCLGDEDKLGFAPLCDVGPVCLRPDDSRGFMSFQPKLVGHP